MKAFVPLNWIIGTLALIAALIGPLMEERLVIKATRDTVERQVENVLKQEGQRYAVSGEYYYFSPDKMSEGFAKLGLTDPDTPYVYSVTSDTSSALIIRAQPDLQKMARASRPGPPLTYVYRQGLDDGGVERGWLSLSNKKRGLF